MAVYNQLAARLVCPRCGLESDMVVDLYFGFRDLLSYQLGDTYRWRTNKSVDNGGRPPEGNLDGEGYTECPICQKDFFATVEVRKDIIETVRPDAYKKPFIPD